MGTPQADEQARTGAVAPGVLTRYPAAVALGGGVAAAFGSSFMPMNAIEGFVTAYGIAELLPAAAPPLGNTARLALSVGIGTLTAGALLALLPRAESDNMGFETAIRKADDAGKDMAQKVAPANKGSKLAGWLRTLRFGKADAVPGTVTDFSDLAALRIRNGDQHPDAPVRAPIRASADLGTPLAAVDPLQEAPLDLSDSMALAAPVMAPIEPQQEARPMPSLRFAPPPFPAPMPATAEPVADEEPDAHVLVVTTPEVGTSTVAVPPSAVQAPSEPETSVALAMSLVDQEPMAGAPVPALPEDEAQDNLDRLSLADLLDRLETGLTHRRRQAEINRPSSSGAENGAQIISLTKPQVSDGIVGSHPVAPQQVLADEGAQEGLASDATAMRPNSLWDNEVEYLPPVFAAGPGSLSDDAPANDEPAVPAPETVALTQPEATPAASPVQEDDMDAALRDALATLRQLSERQRGG